MATFFRSIFFVLIIGFIFVGCQWKNTPQTETVSPFSGGVTIVVKSDDVTSPTYRIEQVEKGETVERVMQQAQAQGLTYEAKEFPGLGIFVIAINGKAQTDERIWVYSVNGQKATQGISTQTVQGGDRIEWNYEPLRF